jgi:hypothetical protein
MATIGKVGNIIQSVIATASETLAQVKMALVLRTDPATTTGDDVVHFFFRWKANRPGFT